MRSLVIVGERFDVFFEVRAYTAKVSNCLCQPGEVKDPIQEVNM